VLKKRLGGTRISSPFLKFIAAPSHSAFVRVLLLAPPWFLPASI